MRQWLVNLALAVLAVFAPIEGTIITTLCLVLADCMFGIAAAKKRKEPITSAGLRRTLTKLFVYEAAVLLAYLVEVYLVRGLLPVSKIITSFIGLTELQSIFESLDIINGSPLLASIVSKLGSENDKIIKND